MGRGNESLYKWSRSHDQDAAKPMSIEVKKKPFKYPLQTKNPMILKLCMQPRGLKLYKVYINDDPGLTLTYFTPRSNLVTYMYTVEWGKVLFKSKNGKNLQQMTKLI